MSKQKHLRAYKKLTPSKVYWSLVLVFIAMIISLGVGVLNQYTGSIKWKASADEKIAMANQSIDMLYDKSETSRENKIKFAALYSKMITKKGDLTSEATPGNVKKLHSYYTHLISKGSEITYKKQDAEVRLKYAILEQFDNLFTDNTHAILDRTVTPTTIVNLNNSTIADLTTLFVQNPNDAFVARIIKQEKKLNKDIIVLDGVAQKFNDAYKFNIDDTEVTLKPGYHDDITAIYRQGMSALNYDWKSTKYMQQINNTMKPIVAWTIGKYESYQNYLDDMKDKSSSYAAWKEQQQEFFANVKSTHAAAVAAKHQAEEIAREQKAAAEAEAKRQAEEKAKNDAAETVPDLTNKTIETATEWATPLKITVKTSYVNTNDKTLDDKIKSTDPTVDGKVYPGYDGEDILNVVIYKYVAPTVDSSSSSSSTTTNPSQNSSSTTTPASSSSSN